VTTPDRGPIVLDTDVFSADLSDTALIALYEPIIVGRPAFVSFQTVAELRYGARRRGWGDTRLRKLDAKIAAVEVVHSGDELVATYARLRADCVQIGHAARPTGARRRSLDRRHRAPPRHPARLARSRFRKHP
jgi:predicted nucleic acid-binding protein